MKFSKKFISMLLALLMVVSIGIPAFAEEEVSEAAPAVIIVAVEASPAAEGSVEASAGSSESAVAAEAASGTETVAESAESAASENVVSDNEEATPAAEQAEEASEEAALPEESTAADTESEETAAEEPSNEGDAEEALPEESEKVGENGSSGNEQPTGEPNNDGNSGSATRPASYTNQIYQSQDGYIVYLAGLGFELSNEVYQKLIEAITTTTNKFSLGTDSLAFIDAEKKTVTEANQDHLLCWAASSSDMLEYSGWLSLVNDFDNVDIAFSDYADKFKDDVSTQYAGLKWFFDGVYIEQGDGSGSDLKEGKLESGGYISEVCADTLLTRYNVSSTSGLSQALNELYNNKSALGLGVNYYNTETQQIEGGHALTIFGYVLNQNNYPIALIVADSDNTPGDSYDPARDRSEAKNIYTAYTLGAYNNQYVLNGYTSGNYVTLLNNVTALKRYDSTATYTDAGTNNAQSCFDLLFNNVCLTNDGSSTAVSFTAGDAIYVATTLFNGSYVDFDNTTDANNTYYGKYSIYNSNNQLVYSCDQFSLPDAISALGSYTSINPGFYLNDAGDYYVVCDLYNSGNGVIEAYLNNNTSTPLWFRILAKIIPSYDPVNYGGSTTKQAKTGDAKFKMTKGKVASSALSKTLSVYVDGKKINSKFYTLFIDDDGYLCVDFTDEYMQTLAAGDHTVEIYVMNTTYESLLTIS